jgi:beta-galactosidase beta subunit
MIFDSLDKSIPYTGLGHNIASTLKFLLENDLVPLPTERIEIKGDPLYDLPRLTCAKGV